MKNTLPVSLLVLSVLLASCGGSKGIVHDADAVLSNIEGSYRQTQDLTIKGTMKVSLAPVTIWYEALVKGYDSLKIVMNGPFGVAVGALAATPEHFLFLNFQDGIAYEGKPDRETLQRASSLQLNYQEIISLMRCEVPHIPTKEEMDAGTMSVEQENGKIIYTIPQGDIVESFTIDPEKLVIIEYSKRRTVGDRTYTDLLVIYDKFFKKVGDRKFPEEARIEINDNDMRMTVTVDKIRGGIAEDEQLTIDVPSNMNRETL